MFLFLLCSMYVLGSVDAPAIYAILAILGYVWYLMTKK